MKQKLAILVVFLAAVAAILVLSRRERSDPPDKKPAVGSAGQASATAPEATSGSGSAGEPVEISFVYSTEKKDWMEAALAGFQQAEPTIKVRLIGQGSFEASQAILDGTLKPTLFSPADSLVASLLDADYRTKTGKALFAAEPQPLLLSPLVFVVWQDRAEVLTGKAATTLTWKAIREAVTSPKGWLAVGGKPGWGFVKLGHTDPTRSNSGLQALLSMSLEHVGRAQLTVDDLLDEKYQAWVKGIESGVTKFESSTGTFMTDMIRFGPSKYDIAVVYESLAVAQLENAQGRWGSLRLYYPTTTLWSDHPVMLLETDALTAAQRSAGQRLIDYLRSTPVQSTALRFGFRPADPKVPMKVDEGANPFTKLSTYGLSLELPPAASVPDAAVVRNLQTLWLRLFARPR